MKKGREGRKKEERGNILKCPVTPFIQKVYRWEWRVTAPSGLSQGFLLKLDPGRRRRDFQQSLASCFQIPQKIPLLIRKCKTFLETYFKKGVLFFLNIYILLYHNISDMEHLFICLLAICIFLGEMSIQMLCPSFKLNFF